MPHRRTRVNKAARTGRFVRKGKAGERGRDLHVVRKPTGGWDVKQGGRFREVGSYATKEEAVHAARELSEAAKTGLVVHRTDGSVQQARAAEGHADPGTDRPERGFGCARGLIRMHPDFEEPLDDFSDYV